MIWAWLASLLDRAGKQDTVRIPRRNIDAVLNFVAPTLVDGKFCADCGGRVLGCSPPIVQHFSHCESAVRYRRIAELLQP